MHLKLKTYPYWASFAVLAIGIALRFIYLDADPQYYDWVGYITDEGRWIQHARSLTLFGGLFDHNMDLHFYLAPFYQLLNYLVFKVAGVSLFSSRLLSAFCGSALLVVVWVCLRQVVTPEALLLGVTLLAFQPDLLALSRVAVPEMPAMFFQALIYFVIVKGFSAWRFALAGFLMFLTVGVKATTLLVLPIFSAVIVLMPRHPDRPELWRGLMLFWAAFLLAVAFFIAISIYVQPERSTNFFLRLVFLWNNIFRGVVGFSGLYGVTSFVFEDEFSVTFNLWAVAVWLAALAWIADENRLDFNLRRYFVTAFVWSLLYTALMVSLEYFPTRYKVHALIPMTLCLIVGISIVQRSGIQAISKFFSKVDGASAALWLPVLCLPTAVFFSSLADSVSPLLAVDPERLRTKLGCLAFLLAGMTYVANRYKQNERVIGFLLCFPLLGVAGWAILSTLRNDVAFWPNASTQFHLVWYGAGIFGLTLLTIVFRELFAQWKLAARTRLVTACALLSIVISLPSVAPGYMDPQYSIVNTSRDLGSLLSSYSTISAIRAEGLFNENRLHYWSRTNWATEKPEVVVTAFMDAKRMLTLQRDYRLMKTYRLLASRQHDWSRSSLSANDGEGVIVSVYERRRRD